MRLNRQVYRSGFQLSGQALHDLSAHPIVMTPKGQRRSHFLQPVQSVTLCKDDVFLKSLTFKLSTWGGHTATHQPQPVQRIASMSGSSLCCTMLTRARQHPTQCTDQVGLGQHPHQTLVLVNHRQMVVPA